MDKSSSVRVSSVFIVLSVLLALPHSAHAQSVSAVFSGPQNMDQGLQNGLNNITGYVAFMPFDAQMP
jgi:hypothetical protein